MHPEFLSMALFWIVAAYTPGPNNVVASYSGFNFGIKKTIPHIFGVTFGFTSVIFDFMGFGIYWLVPVCCVPIITGLTLDYDTFLIARI